MKNKKKKKKEAKSQVKLSYKEDCNMCLVTLRLENQQTMGNEFHDQQRILDSAAKRLDPHYQIILPSVQH